ncbi:LapA family protein [Caldalkalibacillus mannanilyticus]|uniref:LapA family protein n=1 Tax=Caldalkalibacillus mannanilyticus TaxID=1418 RepID=UPI00046A82BA|nr:lipopolysaccharide assembly protein LapA domain-containing protein [Caldalkalibacillus mannanilyticus]
MKGQSSLILGIIFAVIVAIFSVINVESVRVHYLFGEASIPLILVILFSTLAGGMIVGSVGLFRQFSLQKENKLLRKKIEEKLGPDALKEDATEPKQEEPKEAADKKEGE